MCQDCLLCLASAETICNLLLLSKTLEKLSSCQGYPYYSGSCQESWQTDSAGGHLSYTAVSAEAKYDGHSRQVVKISDLVYTLWL